MDGRLAAASWKHADRHRLIDNSACSTEVREQVACAYNGEPIVSAAFQAIVSKSSHTFEEIFVQDRGYVVKHPNRGLEVLRPERNPAPEFSSKGTRVTCFKASKGASSKTLEKT